MRVLGLHARSPWSRFGVTTQGEQYRRGVTNRSITNITPSGGDVASVGVDLDAFNAAASRWGQAHRRAMDGLAASLARKGEAVKAGFAPVRQNVRAVSRAVRASAWTRRPMRAHRPSRPTRRRTAARASSRRTLQRTASASRDGPGGEASEPGDDDPLARRGAP
jgi:hypothetical protein